MPTATNSVGYTSAKAGLIGLTKHVALETADKGVTVNAINPGPVDTERFRRIWENSEVGLTANLASIPVGRAGDPVEIAELVTYLVSDFGAYATGATFDINGGRVMW
jgi:NAD(P)-dependent dehydrogenase (short-subunit alcohol dehydrogenase family)